MCIVRKNRSRDKPTPTYKTIGDKFKSIEQVQQALRESGLESSNLIIGIDYTKSNEYTGEKSFRGKCLHSLSSNVRELNPYQQVISILGRTLEPFDDDKNIPVFGFGDSVTSNYSVFPFYSDRLCCTFQDVLKRYNEITPHVVLAGPTNFAPLIYQAMRIAASSKCYHILIIIADGQVVNEQATKNAIVAASDLPLSIIMVGVGDGPWKLQKEFDDHLQKRKFDNYQFVNFEEIKAKSKGEPEATFAMHALMEIPQQYKAIRALGYLD